MVDYGQNGEIAVLIGTLYFIGRVPRHSKVPPPTIVCLLQEREYLEQISELYCSDRSDRT